MQDVFPLTLLRHQNTKTRWYKASKYHWVTTLFEIFGSTREKLQFTVALDHPVDAFIKEEGYFLKVHNYLSSFQLEIQPGECY